MQKYRQSGFKRDCRVVNETIIKSKAINTSTVSILAVLKCFTVGKPLLTIGEICAVLGISRNMAFRSLSFLSSLNYVIRDSSGRKYQLGHGVLELCNDLTTGLDLRRICANYMRRLQSLTGETVSFSVPIGRTSVVIDGVEGQAWTRRSRIAWGRALPLHGGAAPRAILSCLTDNEIKQYVSEEAPLRQRTGKTMPMKRLMQEIHKIRELGYSLSIPEYVDDGSQHVAFPVRDVAMRAHGAIAVSGPAERLTMKKIEAFLPEMIRLIADLNEQSQLIPSSASDVAL
jgi:IclR family KDG regulon transcriptional repressor